ncbi:MAG: CsoR family transcriptional regulator [Clostridia bacterium]|nr:CsoR family transcriptional regulator [Clostridia bacterium]
MPSEKNVPENVHADGTVYDQYGNHVHADGTVHDEFGNHVHLDGTVCGHVHTHDPDHPHVHTNKKAVLSRLARADGHLQSVMRMIDDNRDCSEVLIQLAAVRSAINNAGKVILRDHINECVTEAVLRGDTQELEELNKAIDQFIK